jgi:regulator of sigma D
MFSFFLVLFLNGGHFTIFDRIYIVGWVHKNPGLIVSYHIQNIFILYENKSHKIITKYYNKKCVHHKIRPSI